jgi:hypothetical protein
MQKIVAFVETLGTRSFQKIFLIAKIIIIII